MKRTIIALVIADLGVVASPVGASAAPGVDIQYACQLTSSARPTGTAVHGNDAGGAAAFSDPAILVAHGCTG